MPSVGRRLAVALLLVGCGTPRDPPPVSTSPGSDGAAQWVDVFIGTANSAATTPVSGGAGGSTFPAAALPFGMVQWGPDTPNASPPGYLYDDDRLFGFSLTHLSGAGCSAMRDFPVMPVGGDWDPSAGLSDSFTHDAELASPGFYEVTLGSGIRVDLTATTRSGLARFTFPDGGKQELVIAGARAGDLFSVPAFDLTVRDDGVLIGQRTDARFCFTSPSYQVYIAARFDRSFSGVGTYDANGITPGSRHAAGAQGGVYLDFDASQGHVVHMKVGLSYVSADDALANLDAEDPGWDFDGVHTAALARWNDLLGRVAVEGGSDGDRRAFYTALYHALLQPAVASDVNGAYVGFDGQPGVADGWVRYQNFSGWDVYRSWVQLISVVAPDEASDILRSLVVSGTECGAMPKWSLANTETGVMVGDPSAPLVAGGWAFGARGFDAQAALALMIKSGTDPTAMCNGLPARTGLATCLAHHYCPFGDPASPQGATSTTVEYALEDFAVAQFAGALNDTATKSAFLARGAYWKNVFDANRSANGFTGYLQPRLGADVGGQPAFQEGDVGKTDQMGPDNGFVEGNAAQYTLTVPHDVPGLIAALGGDAAAIARLDDLFATLDDGLGTPHFYMGNEPGFSSPWAYAFAGAPWKTQALVRRILNETFTTRPGGLPGNDDLGAMSAWQVWAMLGMYPAIPGVGGVVLGSPTFSRVTLTLAGGNTLVITADGTGPYVQSLSINGAPSTSSWISWDRLAGGGTLAFTLGATPNLSFGSAPGDRPPSFY
jgi:predicted alpha-1,2-mannosidase